MSTSLVEPTAERAATPRRASAKQVPDQVDAIVFPRCSNCAGEVRSGAVRSRGSVFCSIECALAAAVPGLYLG